MIVAMLARSSAPCGGLEVGVARRRRRRLLSSAMAPGVDLPGVLEAGQLVADLGEGRRVGGGLER